MRDILREVISPLVPEEKRPFLLCLDGVKLVTYINGNELRTMVGYNQGLLRSMS